MPHCKNCQREIDKFNTDICPYCGEPHPIDPGYKTMDITGNIKTLNGGKPLYHAKSQKVYAFLCIFLGYFGIHDFYIGKAKRALPELLATLILTGGVGALLFFLAWPNAFAFLFPFALCWIFYIVMGSVLMRSGSLKDGRGEFLR